MVKEIEVSKIQGISFWRIKNDTTYSRDCYEMAKLIKEGAIFIIKW